MGGRRAQGWAGCGQWRWTPPRQEPPWLSHYGSRLRAPAATAATAGVQVGLRLLFLRGCRWARACCYCCYCVNAGGLTPATTAWVQVTQVAVAKPKAQAASAVAEQGPAADKGKARAAAHGGKGRRGRRCVGPRVGRRGGRARSLAAHGGRALQLHRVEAATPLGPPHTRLNSLSTAMCPICSMLPCTHANPTLTPPTPTRTHIHALPACPIPARVGR